MLYKRCKIANHFTVFETVQSSGGAIWNGIVATDLANVE